MPVVGQKMTPVGAGGCRSGTGGQTLLPSELRLFMLDNADTAFFAYFIEMGFGFGKIVVTDCEYLLLPIATDCTYTVNETHAHFSHLKYIVLVDLKNLNKLKPMLLAATF